MISKSLGKVLKGIKGENLADSTSYSTVEQMWELELNPDLQHVKKALTGNETATTIGTKNDWYEGSVKYWNQQPATIDGVLGGYEIVHEQDSITSGQMIDDMAGAISGFNTAIDLGAGIGRIAKTTLCPRFKEVDLLEPTEVQIGRAKEYVPEVRKFYQQGIQDFIYERQYDCVWLQWCAMYLTDADLLEFCIKTRQNLAKTSELSESGLQKSGLLFVKENVHKGKFIIDREDNSIMRTVKHFDAIF